MLLSRTVTTTKRRASDRSWNPDLGVLAGRLTLLVAGRALHKVWPKADTTICIPGTGSVLAYLDEDGVRATELARLSGRHKQIVGRLIDELEELGYVERRPDPEDRRAKLIVPTDRGLDQLRRGDEIVAEIEARHAAAIGGRTTPRFRDVLRGVVARSREPSPAA